MNRRNFIRNLGLAVAGAAVASKIELIESIIPIETPVVTVGANSATLISFSALQEAYNRACLRACEPNIMFVDKTIFSNLMDQMEPQMRFIEYFPQAPFDNFRFQNALTTYGELELKQDPMLENFVFREDPEIPVVIGINKMQMNKWANDNYGRNFYKEFV